MKYQKGQSGNLKGCPKDKANGGRYPDWLKSKCREIIEKKKLVEFLADVASGKNVEVFLDINGNRNYIPAKIKDRITATTELLDRGFGKPIQAVELGVNDEMAALLKEARLRVENVT